MIGRSWSHGRGQGHLGDVLSGLLDEELSPQERAAAELHLAVCPTCAAELDVVRTARGWVRGLPAVDPPFGFFERLVLDSRKEAAGDRPYVRSVRRRMGVAAVAASAAAALALLGVAPPQDEPVSPSVARMVEAHATGASLEGDPLSRLAPLGVPVSFGR